MALTYVSMRAPTYEAAVSEKTLNGSEVVPPPSSGAFVK